MNTARHKLVVKLVRRHAFDFDAASSALRERLRSEGVDFSPEATSPTALRKVFASLDRKKARTLLPLSSDGENSTLDGDGCHTPISSKKQPVGDSTTRSFDAQHVDEIKEKVHENLPPEKHGQHEGVPCNPANLPSSSKGTPETTTAAWPSTAVWDFESLLEEQRRKEMQYADQKEKIFEKVLSALPSHSEDSGAAELPSDILQAWDARKEKLAVEAEDAQNRQQKLTEDRSLALQRLALKQRHLPGSDDSVGEDPLRLVDGGATSISKGERNRENGGGLSFQPSCKDQNQQPSKALVRLELGMQPELLDKLLDEIEEESALAAGGYTETNSELSQVIDELDKAAAGCNSEATELLLGGVQE